jgi:hypothetical protein
MKERDQRVQIERRSTAPAQWGWFARLGGRFARKRRVPEPPSREIAPEITFAELAEFLEGDLHPNDARAELRERLRDDLWTMLLRLEEPNRS